MTQHMDVHRERQLSGLTCPLNHPSDAHPPEWLAPFIHEHLSRSCPTFSLESFEASEYVPLKVMDTIGAVFQPTNSDGALGQIEVIPPEIAGFGYTQTVAIDQQADQPITMSVPIALQRSQ